MKQRYICFHAEETEGDWRSVEYIRRFRWQSAALKLTYLLTLGLAYLLKEWLLSVRLLKYRRAEPPLASHLLVTGVDGTRAIEVLERRELDWADLDAARSGTSLFEVSF